MTARGDAHLFTDGRKALGRGSRVAGVAHSMAVIARSLRLASSLG